MNAGKGDAYRPVNRHEYGKNYDQIFTKMCSKCCKKLPRTEFYKNKNHSDGLASECKDCKNQMVKNYYKTNKTAIKSYHKKYKKSLKGKAVRKKWLKSQSGQNSIQKYENSGKRKDQQKLYKLCEKQQHYKFNYRLKKHGLTFDSYFDMLLKQKARCAICRIEQTKLTYLFSIDHNHKTGEIRGLLCSNCNTALGLLKEDFLIINNLKNYLKKHNGR